MCEGLSLMRTFLSHYIMILSPVTNLPVCFSDFPKRGGFCLVLHNFTSLLRPTYPHQKKPKHIRTLILAYVTQTSTIFKNCNDWSKCHHNIGFNGKLGPRNNTHRQCSRYYEYKESGTLFFYPPELI